MVKRTSIGASDIDRLLNMVRAASNDASSGHTTPAGDKVLEGDENVFWGGYDRFGVPKDFTIRDIGADLEAAEGRIEDARASLEDTQVRLEDAEHEAEEAQKRLDTVENETLPAVRAEIQAAADEAAENLGVLEGNLATAKQDLADAKVDLGLLETDLANEQSAREQLAQDTQGTFTELDTRLDTFGDDPALAGLRTQLTNAQDAASNAADTAAAANEAASAASQAALEAAGIAASKGRVIIQDTEPTGEDRNAANIWIKPAVDDPDTDITETATTYVYIESSNEWVPTTSDELAQAAQNALDAREAAQQAQQRAETAVSNAAAAQAAAEAAQATADQATTDAREAHNEAVAAQADAEAAWAEARRKGANLAANPSFEGGEPGAFVGPFYCTGEPFDAGLGEAHTGSWAIRAVEDADGTGAQLRFRVDSGLAGGRFYQAGLWVRIFGTSRVSIPAYFVDGIGDSLGFVPGIGFPDAPQGEWLYVETLVHEAPAGAAGMEWRLQALDLADGEVIYVDDVNLYDVTDARAARLAAEAAMERADEAYSEAQSKVSADDMADAILASANGKNSITRSTSEPSGSGAAEGDAWYQVDGNGDAFGMWIWDGSSWVASKVRNEMIDTLDLNKLVVHDTARMNDAVIDKLWVDGLISRSVATQSLVVGPGNVLPDPSGLNPTIRETYSNSGFAWNATERAWVKDGNVAGSNQILPQPVATRYETYPIIGGRSYSLSFDARIEGGSGEGRFAIYYATRDGSTHFVGDQVEGEGGDTDAYDPIPTDAWTTVTRTWTAPEDAVSGGFALQVNNVTSGASRVLIRNPFVGPKTGAVLIENGAVSADQINAESVAGAVGEFLEVTTDNLTAGGATIDEAVINKVWTDGIAAKSVTASQVAVAAGNLLPNGTFAAGSDSGWTGSPDATIVPVVGPDALPATHALRAVNTGSLQPYNGPMIPVEPGEQYVFEVWMIADRAGSTIYVEFRDDAGNHASSDNQLMTPTEDGTGSYLLSGEPVPTTWTKYQTVVNIDPGVSVAQVYSIYYNHSSGDVRDATVYMTGFSLRKRTGAVLIEDGAVSTPKLNVTEQMTAKLADFMSVATKKLIVSDEAILNQATLIGQTVVDDINVQGKLIGTDGVFTGTVDFANVNVTGELLAEEVSGEYLYGTVVEGGVIRNEDTGKGQVLLGDSAFFRPATVYPPFAGGPGPGIGVDLPDMSGYVDPPGLGPSEDSFVISGGSDSSGGARAEFTNRYVNFGWRDPDEIGRSKISAGKDPVSDAGYVQILSEDGTGRGSMTISRDNVYVGTSLSDTSGEIRAARDEAVVRAEGSGYAADIRCTANSAAILYNDGSMTSGFRASGGGEARLTGQDAELLLRTDSNGPQFASKAIYSRTYSSSTNVHVTSFGTLGRATSSRRYKKNIVDWNPDAEKVLALQPRQWQHSDPHSDIDETFHVGFVAEEVHDLGLKGLVSYAGDGKGGWRPESLNYDRFAAAHQVVLKKHEQEIAELRAENDDLKTQLNSLEARLAALESKENA